VIAVLAGGVGAARLLAGLVRVHPPPGVTAIVNTGDDLVLHGLHISPDIDTVVYTLAGAVNPATGWGLEGETWRAMEGLDRYGGPTWFRLGDRDLATHLFRTGRLAAGAPLSTVTAEIAAAWGIGARVLPATDDPLRTRMAIGRAPREAGGPDEPGDSEPGDGEPGAEIGFQEYFVQRRHAVAVRAVRFAGAARARPAPGVLEAIAEAEAVIIAPSNPIVSIGPVLAVPGLRQAVELRRDRAVAVSPIVAGAALKGPADRLLRELGHESSVVGVARLYAGLVSTLVVDEADAALAAPVEAQGLRCVVAPAVMHGPPEAAALARVVLAAARIAR